MTDQLFATHLRARQYAVRPLDKDGREQCGTCGWSPYPWIVRHVRARNADEAIRKVLVNGGCRG